MHEAEIYHQFRNLDMNIEYHKWFSSHLNKDIELKVYGQSGKPILVFPCQGGRFYEWEDFGMVECVQDFIQSGKIQLFTVDSIDNESWANEHAHPKDRAVRHEQYDQYIVNEVVPFIKTKNSSSGGILTTGASMGAYHAVNFYFRHPDVFDTLIAMSGLYSLKSFIGNYMDDNIYFNSPLDYLPNLEDEWYLSHLKMGNAIIVVGQGPWEDNMIEDTRRLKEILEEKEIPAKFDFWGYDVNHDWPWWRKQLPYFIEQLFGASHTL